MADQGMSRSLSARAVGPKDPLRAVDQPHDLLVRGVQELDGLRIRGRGRSLPDLGVNDGVSRQATS